MSRRWYYFKGFTLDLCLYLLYYMKQKIKSKTFIDCRWEKLFLSSIVIPNEKQVKLERKILKVHIIVYSMVFNATFNNISVILWWSVLLVEETRVPPSHWPTWSHRVVSSTPRNERDRTHNVSGHKRWLQVVNPTTIRSWPRQPYFNSLFI